jgi:hypothetical protein
MSDVSYDTLDPLITQIEYVSFQRAYDHFNTTLFDDELPQVLITLQRKGRSYGYLAPERFMGRQEAQAVHELALNPDRFIGRSDADILSTLVHEMCHVWQTTYDDPPRRGYHNREWAAKMREIGLHPSATGLPGGKQTGHSMSHYILTDGAFSVSYDQLAATGFLLHWESPAHDPLRGAKRASKTLYLCPACDLHAWAKSGVALTCTVCALPLVEQEM